MFRIVTSPRTLVVLAFDCLCVVLAWAFFLVIRYTLEGAPIPSGAFSSLPLAFGVQVACFLIFGLYRGFWRFSSLRDLRRILMAVVASSVLLAFLAPLLPSPPPRSVYLINPLMVFTLLSLGRIIYRWWREERPGAGTRNLGKPVLLLRTKHANNLMIEAFDHDTDWRLVGLLDNDNEHIGRRVYGQPVLGRWSDLPFIARKMDAKFAMLVDIGLDHGVRRAAFELCDRAGVKLMLAPALDTVMSGKITVSEVREIELDDLLGRDPVDLDLQGISAMLGGKTVLVTGAGGSIGSELCRQIAAFKPGKLVLVELNEFAMYSIEQELSKSSPVLPLACHTCDIKDTQGLIAILATHRPYAVFHAAAYKHVPLMEQVNAWQCVRNNSLGTLSLLRALSIFPAQRLTLISTDKAVNPTNVMGASKRLAEIIVQVWAKKSSTSAMTVRFGNVLGSTGSVIPKFQEQIRNGGPVTVTHPEIRRYFMSIPESAKLVLQASVMGQSGEIFVLDMGEPVKIVDLAKDLIHLSGLNQEQIKIEFSGLRPGEKLFEELLIDSETTMSTRHPKVRILRPSSLPEDRWLEEIEEFLTGKAILSDEEARNFLKAHIPEYTPFIEPALANRSDSPETSADHGVRVTA